MKNTILTITILVLFGSVTFASLTDGLVGHWPLDDNANDESGLDNHGTVEGALLTTDRFGNSNSAYSFDGDGDWINCGTDIFSEAIGFRLCGIADDPFWPFVKGSSASNTSVR